MKNFVTFENVCDDFLDRIADEWLFNPDCYDDEGIKEFCKQFGHEMYECSFTYDQFRKAIAEEYGDEIPEDWQLMQWVVNNCRRVDA